MKSLEWFALAMVLVGSLQVVGHAAEPAVKVAEQLRKCINSGDYAGIDRLFSTVMRDALPLEKSTEFFRGLTNQLGHLQRFGPKRGAPPAVVLPAEFDRGTLDMQITLDAVGQIVGLYFRPHVETAKALERNRTRLSLPFTGDWLVFWGGDSPERNQHHEVQNQRFAFDLVGVGADGKTHKGSGQKNEDYYAFCREVCAPAEGTVVEVINGVHDNKPGSMNPYSAVGNCVVVRHSPEEFSVLAHFKFDSIMVKEGDKVTHGQVLGLCGNSGNSSEPHIHYHLQNTAVLQDGVGIKCYFDRVQVKAQDARETKTDYSPVKGEILSPAP